MNIMNDDLDEDVEVEVELEEVKCPRRGCVRNANGICTVYVGGEFYACGHARLREGHWVIEDEGSAHDARI